MAQPDCNASAPSGTHWLKNTQGSKVSELMCCLVYEMGDGFNLTFPLRGNINKLI